MSRASIFAAIRAVKGRIDPDDVPLIDNLLDRIGIPPEDEQDAFTRCLAVILKHEGGYVDHPKDPGGETNLGVTKRTWEGYVGHTVTKDEIKALKPAQVSPLYRKNYWDAVSADSLPVGLALCVFDFAVNAGPSRANRYLQALVSASQDGKTGPATVAAAKAFVAAQGEAKAIKAYQEARRGYYRSLGTFPTFGKGWLRRVDETEATALGWVS